MLRLGYHARETIDRIRRRPRFAVWCIGSVGLPIAATVAAVASLHGVWRTTLPFANADRLVWVGVSRTSTNDQAVSVLDAAVWGARSRTLASIAYFTTRRVSVRSGAHLSEAQAAFVSADFFRVLEVAGVVGRALDPSDHAPGAANVAVISSSSRRAWFGEVPVVLGRTIQVDRVTYTVVGVIPPGYEFPATTTAVWLAGERQVGMLRHSSHPEVSVIARLRPSVTVAVAQNELKALRGVDPAMSEAGVPWVVSLDDHVAGAAIAASRALTYAAVLLLLIGIISCTNLIALEVSRRAPEIAARYAFGASPREIVIGFVVEGVILGLGAATVAILVASAGIEVARGGFGVTSPPSEALGPLWIQAGVVIALALTPAGLLAGAAARQVHSADWSIALREAVRSTASRGRMRFRSAVLMTQVACTIAIILSAVPLIAHVYRLAAIGPGYDSRGIVTAQLALPYPVVLPADAAEIRDLATRLIARLKSEPFVETVAISSDMPSLGAAFPIHARPAAFPGNRFARIGLHTVSPEYFSTLRLPVLAGRTLRTTDDVDGAWAIVLDERAAKLLCSSVAACLGAEIHLEEMAHSARVVGIVPYTREVSRGWSTEPGAYLPFAQLPVPRMTILVRTRFPAPALSRLRDALSAVEPDQSIGAIRVLDDVVGQHLTRPVRVLGVLTLFAAFAGAVLVIGIQGIARATLEERQREIAVRTALGASERELIRLILRGFGAPSALGTGLGVALGLQLHRLLQAQLSGIPAFGVGQILVASAAVLATVALTGAGPAVARARSPSIVRLLS